MHVQRPKQLWKRHKIWCFIAIGVVFFVSGDILHHELLSRGGEFFIVPVLEHILDRIEDL